MFKKILVAEDLDTINAGISQVLTELNIAACSHAKYCDEAYLKIRKALHEGEPYDLLISDLSFLADGRENKLTSGEELIGAVKNIQPNISVIVFSIEDKPFRIKSLFEKNRISGYVFKSRQGIPELRKAIKAVYDGDAYYLSPELSHIRTDKSAGEIDSYDIALLKLLAQGMKQGEIAARFKQTGMSPASGSAVEKKINKLKIYFQAANNVQIVVMAKDLGFI